MTIGQPKKIKYLTNKDLLAEIHRSKATFCSYTDDSYGQYDIILPSLEKVNIRTVAEAKRNRAARLSKLAHAEAVEAADAYDGALQLIVVCVCVCVCVCAVRLL